MSRIQAVLFDLDGTLLDSAPDLVGALNWVRAEEGLPALAVEEMSRHVSRGARGLLQAGMPAADDRQFEHWKARLLSRYAGRSFERSMGIGPAACAIGRAASPRKRSRSIS